MVTVSIHDRIWCCGTQVVDAAEHSLSLGKATHWVLAAGDAMRSEILGELERLSSGRWALWNPAYLPSLKSGQRAYPALHDPGGKPLCRDVKPGDKVRVIVDALVEHVGEGECGIRVRLPDRATLHVSRAEIVD